MTYEPVSDEAGGVTYEQAAGSWYVNANLTMYPAGQVMGDGTDKHGQLYCLGCQRRQDRMVYS